MIDGVTVNELMKACQAEIAKGNGDKLIYISRDDEGNGWHQLWYDFTEVTPDNFEDFDVWGMGTLDPNRDILLG